MNEREQINTIAPALRVLLSDSATPCRLTVRKDGAPDDTLEFTPPDGNAAEVIDALRAAVTSASPLPSSVTVPGLASFVLTDAPSPPGRVASKVALVTGAAQGFGLEIASALACEGASVVFADINGDGTHAAAAEINKDAPGRTLGVVMDVTDAESIAAALHETVCAFGGLDLFVSNAGVLKAAGVKEQCPRDFDFVTRVNYTGYFLCTQAVAPIMAAAHLAGSTGFTDIVQINSKSGLVGSNRNGAYAGSKFGGIGLTQSFALELVEDAIKVNSICPGNFFDGPLWSDPTGGLFAQYLHAGKVPGAKTVDEVRAAYEAKVPMGRGCTTKDVMRAIYYLVDQQYETGQALPVAGGQVMLS